MRKIKTKEQKEKKQARNKTIISSLLVILLLFSTLGYAFYNTSGEKKNIEYKNIKFSLTQSGFWQSKIQGYDFLTSYTPQETENISGNINLNLQDYFNKPLYLDYQSSSQGIQEISRNLQRFVTRIQFSCINNCSENFPIKNCSQDNIISIKSGNKTLINQQENCIYISGKEKDLLRATDAFIYKLLKI